MKKIINILVLLLFCKLALSQTIEIIKGENVPDNVCNITEYSYKINYTLPSDGWSLTISSVLGSVNTQQQVNQGGQIVIANTWSASNNSNIGKIKAKLTKNNITVEDEITVTIKSILHLEPNLTPYTNGNTYLLAPCSSGQLYLEVTKLDIPGTGTLNPEKVYNYVWVLPAGWSANGITSTGSNEIYGGSNITATYPVSSTSGTIKVKGYQAITGCNADVQSSKYATATITRDVTINLTANKPYFLCGDTNPITFTVSANPALPCAVYYWNNSTTPTSSNTFQVTPGLSNVIVTVKVVYGGKEVVLPPLTVPVKSFDGAPPQISGASSICGSQAQYTVLGLRPGYTVDWDCSSRLSELSVSGNSATFSVLGSGIGYIYAKVITPCGDEVDLDTKEVWIGKPEIDMQTPLAYYPNGGYNNVCKFQDYKTNLIVNGATYVTWTRIAANPSNTSWSQVGNNLHFYFWAVNQTAVFRVSATNSCGTTSHDFGFKSIICGSDPCLTDYTVSPNPASGYITIVPNIPAPCDTYLTDPLIQEVSVYNSMGIIEKSQKFKEKTNSAVIETSNLFPGLYVVVIDDGTQKIRKTILIKK